MGELAARLPVGRPAVSKHLRVLSNAGLIEHRSAGTRNLYTLAPDGWPPRSSGWSGPGIPCWPPTPPRSALRSRGAAREHRPRIHREVLVDADPDTAFEVFTARIARWWPLAEHGVYGAGATVAFDDGQIVGARARTGPRRCGARSRGGSRRARWRSAGIRGSQPDRASHVEVTFAAAADQTLVTLEHTGWEVFADPAAARAEYDHGWPMVLDRTASMRRSRPGPGDTWVALMHRPGPGRAGHRAAWSRTRGSPSTSRS